LGSGIWWREIWIRWMDWRVVRDKRERRGKAREKQTDLSE
jgi:hypothetical protein